MHTVTLTYYAELKINVDKLIKLTKGRKTVKRSLKRLESDRLNRSKRSGFAKKRYEKTDIKYPILINQDDILLDGRHRLCKLHDLGRKFANCIIVNEKDINKCIIHEEFLC